MLHPNYEVTDRDSTASVQELKLGLQVAGVGLARLDYASNLVSLSPEAAAMYGFAPDELKVSRDRFYDTFHPDERAELEKLIDRVLDPGGMGWFARDHRVVWPNGEVRWLSVRQKVFFTNAAKSGENSSGASLRPDYAILAAIDITDRQQTEAALLESEERFRTLADNISQFAWMADATGWLFWYNRRWFEYTGTTLDQMQGWGWQQVHHPEHLARVVEHFRHSLITGEAWEDTFPLRGRDGTYRWFLSRAIPIADAQGQIFRWFGTNTDITELKQAQAALEERNQELDNFVHLVSHDLKSPLRAIANLSEWIEADLEGTLSAETQSQMELLRSRVDRMQATIDGLLEYARIGRTPGMIERVEVSELLLETIDSLAPPPTFTIAIDPNLPTLNTNRLLLSQVFSNLIENGIKHHDRVDGNIRVSAEDRGDVYEFAVTDDGPGIAPEDCDRMFVIFQARNPQNRPDSTGIGLAIVKKIIESEGGTIRLESQLGQGTTFYFTWVKSSSPDTTDSV